MPAPRVGHDRRASRPRVRSARPRGLRSGVNLMALVTRFATTCWRRAGSPRQSGRLALDTPRELHRLRLRLRLHRPRRRPAPAPARSTSSRSGRCLPATMRETSSRSSTSLAWRLRAALDGVAHAWTALASRWPLLQQPAPGGGWTVSGVRSSCDRMARNRSLAAFACSAGPAPASARASSSARRRSPSRPLGDVLDAEQDHRRRSTSATGPGAAGHGRVRRPAPGEVALDLQRLEAAVLRPAPCRAPGAAPAGPTPRRRARRSRAPRSRRPLTPKRP